MPYYYVLCRVIADGRAEDRPEWTKFRFVYVYVLLAMMEVLLLWGFMNWNVIW